jgi:hypothetical protein
MVAVAPKPTFNQRTGSVIKAERGRLVIGHTDKAARRLCPTSLLCNAGSGYSEEPGVEIL